MSPLDIASEAEQQVLGAIILDPSALGTAVEEIHTEDFALKKHRVIWSAMVRLSDRVETIDNLTVTRELESTGELLAAGGPAYLAELINVVPSAANVKAHCRLIKEQRAYRALADLGQELIYESQRRETSSRDLMEMAEQRLFQITHRDGMKGFVPLSQVLKDSVTYLEERSKAQSHVTGVSTGFKSLDRITGGWQNSDLIVIAARPSMGKTALAMQCAVAAARETQRPVVVFSLEMSAQQLGTRLLCEESNINGHVAKTGLLGHDDWWKLAHTAGELEQVQLWINDSPTMTLTQLRSAVRRFHQQDGLAMVAVDYLQLLPNPPDAESRQQGITEISRSLKLLAKELNVPVLALSQLSRAVETRTDKRPVLSDLRESGAIEQDADLVMFIYREDMYEPETEKKGFAEILIRKHRNGPAGDCTLLFLEQFARFEDLP